MFTNRRRSDTRRERQHERLGPTGGVKGESARERQTDRENICCNISNTTNTAAKTLLWYLCSAESNINGALGNNCASPLVDLRHEGCFSSLCPE